MNYFESSGKEANCDKITVVIVLLKLRGLNATSEISRKSNTLH